VGREGWRGRLEALRRELAVVGRACRHPRVPWYTRALGVAVLAYALSPIDLIPDFIPILGHLDDALLVPLGLWLVLRTIPPDVMAECRAGVPEGRPVATRSLAVLGAVAVLLVWGGVVTVVVLAAAGR
jgi:uncharacterized membrane protein YkvA (DUF1232 family)